MEKKDDERKLVKVRKYRKGNYKGKRHFYYSTMPIGDGMYVDTYSNFGRKTMRQKYRKKYGFKKWW